jgi:predicted nucleotidyltransferase
MTSPTSHNQDGPDQQTVDSVVMLSDEFLQTLITEIDNDDIVGITLGGSYVRGNATPYSDVDLGCFYKDDASLLPHRFIYRNGLLVSINTKTVAQIRIALTRPEQAIFLIATPRRILLDKDGSVGELMQEIATFRLEPLRQKARAYASFQMMLAAELVHKILSEILRRNDLAIASATAKLLTTLTEIVAVQGGLLIKSDSVYYQQVEEAVGPESAWTRYHRLVAGIDMLPANVSPVKVRAVAALHLYQETIDLLRVTMQSEHLAVAEQAMQVFRDAGPRLRL